MKFKEGQRIRAVTTYTDDRTGLPFDPGTIVARFKDPHGAVATPVAVRNAQGVWEEQVKLSPAGTWWGRVEGQDESGEIVALDEFPIEVEPSHF
jgi:hypothetical protein